MHLLPNPYVVGEALNTSDDGSLVVGYGTGFDPIFQVALNRPLVWSDPNGISATQTAADYNFIEITKADGNTFVGSATAGVTIKNLWFAGGNSPAGPWVMLESWAEPMPLTDFQSLIGIDNPTAHDALAGMVYDDSRQMLHLLTVADGATFTSAKGISATGTSGIIGFRKEGGLTPRVTIEGRDSNWTQDGSLAVGWEADGELLIQRGGAVNSQEGVIARLPGSQGFAHVRANTGSGGTWNINDSLYVGGSPAGSGGSGRLEVDAGARVNVGRRIAVFADDVIDVSGDGVVLAGTTNNPIDPGTLFVGSTGSLVGNGSVVGNVENGGGLVAPGFSPGVLEIDGDFTNEGVLELEIFSSDVTDLLKVTGQVSLGGTLRLLFGDEFIPMVGQSFDLLTAAEGISGEFQVVETSGLPAGVEFATSFSAGVFSVQTTAVPEPSTALLLLVSTSILGLYPRRTVAARSHRRRTCPQLRRSFRHQTEPIASA